MPPAFPSEKFAAAVAAEKFQRSAAFLDVPERVCGLIVNPLSIRHVVILDVIGSPFVCGSGNAPEVNDIVNFLWLLNPSYNPSQLAKRWFYLWHCRKLDYLTVVKAIAGFVSESFADSGGGGGESKQYYSTAAGIIDIVASEYGWSEDDILDLPVKRALQYVNAATRRKNPRAILWNPSEAIAGDWLKECNARKN